MRYAPRRVAGGATANYKGEGVCALCAQQPQAQEDAEEGQRNLRQAVHGENVAADGHGVKAEPGRAQRLVT